MKQKVVCTVLVSMLLLFTIVCTETQKVKAESTTVLHVDHPSIIDPTLKPGKTFSINITIANVTDLHSYDIKLGYGATLLNVLSIEVFPIENLPSPTLDIDDQVGVIWINVTYGESVTTQTPVTLATIKFQVEDIGESILDLHDTKLADSQGKPIPHEAFDGYFDNRTPPTASFTYSPLIPLVNETVTFDASASYDPDGTIVSYAWDFGDGTPTVVETDPVTTHVYIAAGTYTVTLTVTDNDALTTATTQSITIATPPVAIFTYSPETPLVDQTVTFDASASYDLDGTIVSYSWDFGDGTTGTGVIVTHAYTAIGTYNVTLVVTDDDGLTDTATAVITVSGVVETMVFFNINPNPATVGQTVTLKGILVDEFSQPLKSETVKLYARPLAGPWRYITSLTTNDYGIFMWQATIPVTGTFIFAVYYPGSETYESCYNFDLLMVQ